MMNMIEFEQNKKGMDRLNTFGETVGSKCAEGAF
jgi:hypothetical protein